ncbi:MAG: glycosyltransferase [Planctomycetota bacterium]
MALDLSIILATRDRAELLDAALASLAASCDAFDRDVEVILADNGSSDATAEVMQRWVRDRPHWRSIFVAERGKARALNRALREASAPLLLFTDDDVELPVDWVTRAVEFFQEHPEFGAAVGRVEPPRDVADPEQLALAKHFGTLPLYDRGREIIDDTHLYGCNMGIRREVLDRVGPFDERLGPGASGLHEDGDMARRIHRSGFRIGYMPDTVVHHVIEPERLNEEYFRNLHVRDARSRFVVDAPEGRTRAVRRLAGAWLTYGLWSACRNQRRSMKAKARVISHREYLRLFSEGS